MSGFGAGSGIASAISSIASNVGSNSGGSGMAFDWSQLPHVIHEGINTTINAAGFVNSLRHSSQQGATWGDLLKSAKVQDLYNAKAEARALSNSKELFRFQNIAGPQFSVEGYQRAGLNPVLVGGFNSSMPSFSTSTVSPQAQYVPKVDKSQAFYNFASGLQALRESESRIEANRASAKSLEARTQTEDAMRQYKQALTYYKAINESQVPLKLKAFLKGQAIQNVVNATRILLMNSQQRVNAKQAELIEQRAEYFKAHAKDSRIGWNNTYINFNFKDLSSLLERLLGGGNTFEEGKTPFLGR